MNTMLAALTPELLIGPLVSGIIGGTLFAVLMRWATLRKLRNVSADQTQIATASAWRTYIAQGFGMAFFLIIFTVLMRLMGH